MRAVSVYYNEHTQHARKRFETRVYRVISPYRDQATEYCDERVRLSVCVCVSVCPPTYPRN